MLTSHSGSNALWDFFLPFFCLPTGARDASLVGLRTGCSLMGASCPCTAAAEKLGVEMLSGGPIGL